MLRWGRRRDAVQLGLVDVVRHADHVDDDAGGARQVRLVLRQFHLGVWPAVGDHQRDVDDVRAVAATLHEQLQRFRAIKLTLSDKHFFYNKGQGRLAPPPPPHTSKRARTKWSFATPPGSSHHP